MSRGQKCNLHIIKTQNIFDIQMKNIYIIGLRNKLRHKYTYSPILQFSYINLSIFDAYKKHNLQSQTITNPEDL